MGKHDLITPTTGPFPYREARLSEGKDWIVEYGVWSEQQQKIIRKRTRIPAFNKVDERRLYAAQLIQTINDQLGSPTGLVSEIVPDFATFVPPGGVADADLITIKSSLVSALDFFLKTKQKTLKKQSAKTYASCGQKFRLFLDHYGLTKMRLVQFTHQHAFAYLDYLTHQQQLANKTINKHTGFAETLFQYVKERKLIKANPFEGVDKLVTQSGRHIPFLPEQIQQFKDYLNRYPDPQLWLFVNFIYYTFSRPHEEIRLLQIRDVGKRAIMIHGDRSKGGKSNPKQIAPPLEALIERSRIRHSPPHFYVFGPGGVPGVKPMGETYFYAKHRFILDEIKLPRTDYDLYGWKHTGVIALYQHSKDIKLIQRLCGHKHITTTEIYLRDLGLFLDDDELNGFPAL